VESESEGILGGVGVGRNIRWSRKEFLGGVGVGRNIRWSRKEFLGGAGAGAGRNIR
jgi:hypothetical protein